MKVFAIVSVDNEVIDVFLTYETALDILNSDYNSDYSPGSAGAGYKQPAAEHSYPDLRRHSAGSNLRRNRNRT